MHEFMSRRVVPTTDDINTASRPVDGSTRGRWDGIYGLSFVNREVSTSMSDIEVVLPNGDLYIGSFRENVPYGNGKYLWADGCMYEGEWRTGKASGRGKFSWPSGATYEGQFKDGRMEGKGTFISADGDTYRGSWVRDRKHGFGEKWYANGDIYTGLWKWNIQDGDGRYVWTNGNEYIGEWKNGVMCGKGVLIWANGKRYDGDWVDGAPKGTGVFTWPDGDDLGARSGNRRSRRSSMNEKNLNLNLPKICTSESDSESTCDVVGNKEAKAKLMLVEKNEEVAQLRKSPGSCEGAEAKKCGQVVSKGHKSYDLILNFQLGIRYSTGKHCALTRELKPADFDPNEKFWTRFPPEGSKSTPPHQSPDFKWKDYCPMVFKNLRELFEIDPAEYMLAICGSDALRELSSPGKSGSLFYLTHDDRFIIKTLKKSEVKVLLRMLPNYYEHISQCKNSLVTKFFGLHCVKPVGGQKIRFTVMENVFYSEYSIHKRFDLKGSSYGRITDKPDVETDETTTFKDLDLDYVFHLRKSWFDELIRLIDRDCQFLEAENIMDYSLLIGVHFCNTNASSVDDPSVERNDQDYQSSPTSDNSQQSQKKYTGLGRNIPGKAIRVSRMESDYTTGNRDGNSSTGHNNAETFSVILYLGVIDILQDYDISKKLEHAYKSFQVDPTSISAVDPKLYSKRFRDFIYKIFQEDIRIGEAEETTNENDAKTT